MRNWATTLGISKSVVNVAGALTALMLVGGSGCGEPPNGSIGENPQIGGQISNWTLGTGRMAEFTAGDKVVTAPIDASGNFSLMLPTATLLEQVKFTDANCTNAFTIEPAGLMQANGALRLKSSGSGGSQTIYLGSRLPTQDKPYDTSAVNYSYVTQDGSVHGTSTCKDSNGNVNSRVAIDVTLKKGWNQIQLTLTQDTSVPSKPYTVFTYTTGPVPADWKWFLSQ